MAACLCLTTTALFNTSIGTPSTTRASSLAAASRVAASRTPAVAVHSNKAAGFLSITSRTSVSTHSLLPAAAAKGRLSARIQVGVVAEMENHEGILIEKNPSPEKLKELGVKSWGKWGCGVSNFPWTYSAKETAYVLEGEVYVTPAGSTTAVKVEAGDLVVFPAGMSCTWDVKKPIDKHFRFD